MDPRQQRTVDALRRVILEIAAEQPIDQVQVAEVARRAGITRSTFYNQAASPSALLASYLAEELDVVRERFRERRAQTGGNLAEVWAESERELVDHLRRNAAIYKRDLTDSSGGHFGPTLRNMLADHLELGLREHLELYTSGSGAVDAVERDMYAAFVAQGTVGAFEVWLRSPEPRDSDAATRIILRSLPNWWFEPTR